MADTTNTNNITVNMENLSEEERKQLMAIIEKANKPKETGLWKPATKEPYYFIQYSTGDIIMSCNDGIELDNDRFTIGNVFRTKEDAEFVVERLKIIQQLRELTGGFKPKQRKAWYYIYYNLSTDKIEMDGSYSNTVYPMIAFATREDVQKAIDTIGKDRLKKYYFGIEE